MSNAIGNIVEGNWDQLKGQIKRKWRKLPIKDLKSLDWDYDEFVGKLKQTYGYTQLEVEQQIRDFLESKGFDDLPEASLEFWQRVQAVPQKVTDTMQGYAQQIRDTSEEHAETVKKYIKKNPAAAIGIAAGVGFLLAKLLRLRD